MFTSEDQQFTSSNDDFRFWSDTSVSSFTISPSPLVKLDVMKLSSKDETKHRFVFMFHSVEKPPFGRAWLLFGAPYSFSAEANEIPWTVLWL